MPSPSGQRSGKWDQLLLQKPSRYYNILFSKYGIPEQVVSDNGPQFRADEFAEFMTSLGIKHYRSAVYRLATNGAVERLVKTLKQSLKAAHLAGTPSIRALNDFLCKYRATPHAVTGVTPGELFLGRPIRTMLDLLKPNFREWIEQKQAKQKEYHDKRRSHQQREIRFWSVCIEKA